MTLLFSPVPLIFSKSDKLMFSLLAIFKTNGEKNFSDFKSIFFLSLISGSSVISFLISLKLFSIFVAKSISSLCLFEILSVSINAIGLPTLTISPSFTKICDSLPEQVDGISVSTLSVATSRTDSSSLIIYPSFLSHYRMVPSIMLSPILGITISILSIY